MHLSGASMTVAKGAIAVLTRYPRPGRCKTRLIPLMGKRGASMLHKALAEHTISRLKTYVIGHPADLIIFYSGAYEAEARKWLGEDIVYAAQPPGDLGAKIAYAFEMTFQIGYGRTLVLGTDCPDMDLKILDDAFSALESKDMVLGPAEDGGYYLVGLKHACSKELFEGIPWGSAQVLETTVERAKSLKLHLEMLPLLPDLDRPDDLLKVKDAGIKAVIETICCATEEL